MSKKKETATTTKIQIDGKLSGKENMRRDLQNFENAETLSPESYLIRIYEWEKPTISLGISQKSAEFEKYKNKVDIVKRVTGGRAVLHYDEITYSVAAPLNSIYFSSSLYKTYKIISATLLNFLKKQGIDAEIIRSKNSNGNKGAVCFDMTSIYEIEYNGKKLIGSAQKRGKKSFLQHGSIPVFHNQAELANLIDPNKTEKKNDYISLSDYLPNCNLNQLKQDLKNEFEKFFEKKQKQIKDQA